MSIDFSTLPNENSKRFVAILNKKVELGSLFNALGHMTVGLAGGYSNSADLCLLPYEDKDGNKHPNISHFPFIVLKADNSNQLKTIRQEALNRSIPFTDFTDTMTIGTSEDQVNATKSTSLEELELYGICLFGNTEELREFTKKFSLFK
jgi:hypothetical protein